MDHDARRILHWHMHILGRVYDDTVVTVPSLDLPYLLLDFGRYKFPILQRFVALQRRQKCQKPEIRFVHAQFL